MADQISMTTNADASSGVFVNGVEILERDIAEEMQFHNADSMEESKLLASRALVIRELLIQRAKELELDKNLETMEDEPEEEALIRSLMDIEVIPPAADEENCRRYFDSNQERFRTTALLAASHILIAASPDEEEEREEARKMAEAVIESIQKDPEGFSKLAKAHSSCPSREVGGSLGQLSKGQTVIEFEKVLFSTETPGLITHPIESRYGFHIARIDHFEAGKLLEFKMVEQKIKNYLQDTIHRTSVNQYINLLASEATVDGVSMEVTDDPLVQ